MTDVRYETSKSIGGGLGHHPDAVPRAMVTYFPKSCAKKMGGAGRPSRNNRTGYSNPNKKNKPQGKKHNED